MFVSSTAKKPKERVFLTPEGEIRQERSRFIWALLILFVIMVGIGYINLYSASIGASFFNNQLKSGLVAIAMLVLFGWFIPLRTIHAQAYWIYGATCVALLVVDILGHAAGGSQRWLAIGPLRGQPSEFAKLAMAIMIARYFFDNKHPFSYRMRDLWPLGVLAGISFALIFKQPDLGTAGVCILIAMCQLAFIRIDMRSILIVFSSSFAMAIISWFTFLHDYQKRRVLTLLNPSLDPQNAGYHSLQSLIAVGSGKLTGKGFMQGTQTQLQFLPARHTDFIFSVFSEEHGFWGCVVVFILFSILCYVGLEIARRAKDTFTGLLAIGVTALFFVEFAINVAMVLVMFPVVGVPLPFFSFGGSSLITCSMALGILIAIERENTGRTKMNQTLLKGTKHAQ